MWPDYWHFRHAPRARVPNPFPGDETNYGAYVLVGKPWVPTRFKMRHALALAGRPVEAGAVPNAALAQSLADVKAFWRIRDASGELHPRVAAPPGL